MVCLRRTPFQWLVYCWRKHIPIPIQLMLYRLQQFVDRSHDVSWYRHHTSSNTFEEKNRYKLTHQRLSHEFFNYLITLIIKAQVRIEMTEEANILINSRSRSLVENELKPWHFKCAWIDFLEKSANPISKSAQVCPGETLSKPIERGWNSLSRPMFPLSSLVSPN